MKGCAPDVERKRPRRLHCRIEQVALPAENDPETKDPIRIQRFKEKNPLRILSGLFFFFLVATFLVFISRFITIPPPRIVGFFSQNGTTFLGHQRPIENTSGRGEGGTRTRRLWTILLRRSSTHFSAIFLDSFSRNLHDRVNPPKTNKTPEGRTRRFSGAVMKLD